MRKRIQRAAQWVKNRKEWMFFWSAVILVLAAGFGFGYFIGKQAHPAPIIIEQSG